MSERDDLFTERGLSPRRVKFWLLHWGELEAMAESPSTRGSVREYLRREWIHLQDRHPSIACICGPTDHEPIRAREQGGSGGYGPSSGGASIIKGDLELAADQLPVAWIATGRVFVAQSTPGNRRDRLWLRRRTLWLAAGHLPSETPEPPGSDQTVRFMMARATGWRAGVDEGRRSA
jgi:hypothetical protein